MITKIQMKNCLPYDAEGVELANCKKVNFIYGANGSGKSTISEFLRNYAKDLQRYAESSITWSTLEHSPIMVYNREFRKQNFSQDTGIPGVFTLGAATIEDIKTLEKLKVDLSNKREDYNRKCASLRKKEEEKQSRTEQFKDDVWNQILKPNEAEFQKAFEGFRSNKSKFFSELLRREKEHKGQVYARDQLITRAKTLYAKKPEKCVTVTCSIDQYTNAINSIRLNPIWNTVITGNEDVEIGKLIKHLENSSWVRQGRVYMNESTCICPFCQKETIDDSFRKQLEEFFDSEFDEKMRTIEKLHNEFCNNAEQIINAFTKASQAEKVVEIGKLDYELFVARVNALQAHFDNGEEVIRAKQVEPGKKIDIIDVSTEILELQEMVKKVCENIAAHNSLVERIDDEIISLTDDVWATCIENASTLINTYYKDISGIEKAAVGIMRIRDELKKAVDELYNEVIEKGNNVTSVQPTINEINRSLKAYGFNNFSIVPADGESNMYKILREDGTSAAHTLSEGEETFLTFLYFMQLTKGATDREHVSDKKIIVLDDPISSLDSTILYIVGNMVKELSKVIRNGEGDVEQLFVLTHNVFFHKEASFIDGRTYEIGDVNYWIIRKDNGISRIQSYEMKNPISTSYELLWKELRENDDISVISLQNTMRRIIENYFGMLGNRKDDYLVEKFESPEEKTICRSLLAWINDGSHSIPDDLYIDSYTDAVPRYKEVFRKIFKNSGNEAHYNMMMGIVGE